MTINKTELDSICYVLEKYIQIYEDYDVEKEKNLLKKLMLELWSGVPENMTTETTKLSLEEQIKRIQKLQN